MAEEEASLNKDHGNTKTQATRQVYLSKDLQVPSRRERGKEGMFAGGRNHTREGGKEGMFAGGRNHTREGGKEGMFAGGRNHTRCTYLDHLDGRVRMHKEPSYCVVAESSH